MDYGQRMRIVDTVPGGPKLRYMNQILRILLTYLSKCNMPISDLEKLSTDRHSWKVSGPVAN